VRDKAKALIDEVLRPLIEADGGQIELVRVEGSSIHIRLSGTCLGCPGRPYTLARVVEPLLKRRFGNDIVVVTEGN
jgi:Fe-S cluster biogenesis protein NfuA